MFISCTSYGMVRPRRSSVSTAMLAMCTTFAWQGAQGATAPAQPNVDTQVRSTYALSGYQYVGRTEVEGRPALHLTKGSKLYTVRVGDVIDGTLRVDSIKADGLELTHLSARRKQFVAFSNITPQSSNQGPAAVPAAPVTEPPPVAGIPGPVPTAPGVGSPSQAGGVPVAPPLGTAESSPAAGVTPGAAAYPGSTPPAMGSGRVAQPTVPATQSTAGASPMAVSPPNTEMPVTPPTVSTMPTLPPGTDMPFPSSSGETMATTPPDGGM